MSLKAAPPNTDTGLKERGGRRSIGVKTSGDGGALGRSDFSREKKAELQCQTACHIEESTRA